ncbi:MAG: cytochrome c biogenesis protein CcsA, partial [Methanomicrobiales archaeon]|nr:cytochrome c biogenesis protein CcsA [Methanomicrobiales archaeon]
MDPIIFLGIAAGPILIVAAVLFLLDFFLLYAVKPDQGKIYALMYVGSLIACMLVIASYLILTGAFLTDSFSFQEVYTYSSSSLSVVYKLGGPWIGSSGSVLFITVLLSLIYGIYRLRGFEREDPVRTVAYQITDVFIVFFILLTFVQSPYRQLPVTPIEGMGLNPLLQTPWVLSHPPIIFLGYVAVFFAFILVLAGLITRTESHDLRSSVRLPLLAAWLLLT